jgi:mRNA interferase RelE/StbE
MPGHYRQRARRLMESLANNPQPTGAKELRDLPSRYRLRLNGWRIIYHLDEENLTVLILRVRRKTGPEIYQDLEGKE